MKADKEGGWDTGPACVLICLTWNGRRMDARKRACGSADESKEPAAFAVMGGAGKWGGLAVRTGQFRKHVSRIQPPQ